MKLIYTNQALQSLKELLEFIVDESNIGQAQKVRDQILSKVDRLQDHPHMGQKEIYLEHLGLAHRRIVVSHYKIIYRIKGHALYITDIFDTRQDPSKMKG